jgi:hypothetical protein
MPHIGTILLWIILLCGIAYISTSDRSKTWFCAGLEDQYCNPTPFW